MMFTVSQSKIKCWRDCRRKYYYKYDLGLERKRTPKPLVIGRIIHSMIEYHLLGRDPWIAWNEAKQLYGKMFLEEREEYGDVIGDIDRLMVAYFDWYERDPLKPVKISGLQAEIDFEVELASDILLRGKIDQVAQTKDKLKWLVDHKTYKSLPEGDFIYSDVQMALYVWAMDKLKWAKLDGVCFNYIRSRGPTVPEPLKDGSMSKRAIDTFWPVYLAALRKAKLNPRDYEDMREKLEGKEAEFFVRTYFPVNKSILANIVEEATQTALEIATHKPKDIVRTLDRFKCERCEFRDLCNAELRGLDASYIRKHDYLEKKRAKVEA